MKRKTPGLAGILVAGCITVASPAFADTAIEPRADEVVESFFARVPDDVIAISHGGGGPIALFPADIPTLHESGIDNGVAILTKFRNSAGEIVGFGAQLEVILAGDVAAGDRLQATNWILVIPGRGTLYHSELEELGDFGTQVIQPVLATGRDWEGTFMRVATVGPRPDGRGEITGGTYEFSDLVGSFAEIQNYRKITAAGQLFTTTELRLFKRTVAAVDGATR